MTQQSTRSHVISYPVTESVSDPFDELTKEDPPISASLTEDKLDYLEEKADESEADNLPNNPSDLYKKPTSYIDEHGYLVERTTYTDSDGNLVFHITHTNDVGVVVIDEKYLFLNEFSDLMS